MAMADLPDMMGDLPVTMIDLPNTMVDLPHTMVDLLTTMVDIPNDMVKPIITQKMKIIVRGCLMAQMKRFDVLITRQKNPALCEVSFP